MARRAAGLERHVHGNAGDDAGDKRERRGATAGGRATKRKPARNRDNGLRIGHAAGHGLTPHRGARVRAASSRSEARAKRAMWHNTRQASTAAHVNAGDAAGNKRGRRGATAGGRAAKRLPTEIGATVCDLGRGSGIV